MTVYFEHEGRITATAGLSYIPNCHEIVTIWGKPYNVVDFKHEVEIGLNKTGKKKVIEKIICVVEEETEC